MAVSERTYTFRAPADLGERMLRARATFEQLAETVGHDELESWMATEFGLSLLRKAATIRADEASQSTFIREAVELLVGAAEKVEHDLESAEAYRAWASEDSGAAQFRAGALRSAADRLRDE